MKTLRYRRWAGAFLAVMVPAVTWAAEATVATAVYGRVGNGYKREKAKDGSFKTEYYALSNGGRVDGTTSDTTVERVTYPEVAEIATRLLAQKNYHYAQTKEQAKLLLVLQWGSTIGFDGADKQRNIASAQAAMAELPGMQAALHERLMAEKIDPEMTPEKADSVVKNTTAGLGRSITSPEYSNQDAVVAASVGAIESNMLRTLVDNRVRDELNQRNARVLGYLDDLADSNDIRRFAGGGDRYSDMITEVEESRYYIVVSAYDFPELLKTQKKKLLWQTRVSVRSPGNAFDDSLVAMMKSASRYFGQNSGQLVRGEESKGTVELGDMKFLGEAKNPEKSPSKERK